MHSLQHKHRVLTEVNEVMALQRTRWCCEWASILSEARARVQTCTIGAIVENVGWKNIFPEIRVPHEVRCAVAVTYGKRDR